VKGRSASGNECQKGGWVGGRSDACLNTIAHRGDVPSLWLHMGAWSARQTGGDTLSAPPHTLSLSLALARSLSLAPFGKRELTYAAASKAGSSKGSGKVVMVVVGLALPPSSGGGEVMEGGAGVTPALPLFSPLAPGEKRSYGQAFFHCRIAKMGREGVPAPSLTAAVVGATTPGDEDPDPTHLAFIKAIVRSGGEPAAADAATALVARLQSAPSRASRTHALAIADALFSRSKAFRRALCDRLPDFLDGAAPAAFPVARPAPSVQLAGGLGAAAGLTDAATATLARWDAAFGDAYGEVRAARRFLDRAASERAQHRQRAQQQQQQQQPGAAGRPHPDPAAVAADAAAVLRLVDGALEVAGLAGEEYDDEDADAVGSGEDGDDGAPWEDAVARPPPSSHPPTPPSPGAFLPTEGLRSYAAADDDGAPPTAPPATTRSPLSIPPALSDTLADLAAALGRVHGPAVGRWVAAAAAAGDEGELEQARALQARLRAASRRLARLGPVIAAARTVAEEPVGTRRQPAAPVHDPTAARPLPPITAAATQRRPGHHQQPASTLPATVRAALAAAAPVLPSGPHLTHWDSAGPAPSAAAHAGLALSTHWGAFDPAAPLPRDVAERLAGVGQLARYYEPPTEAAAAGATARVAEQLAAPRRAAPDPRPPPRAAAAHGVGGKEGGGSDDDGRADPDAPSPLPPPPPPKRHKGRVTVVGGSGSARHEEGAVAAALAAAALAAGAVGRPLPPPPPPPAVVPVKAEGVAPPAPVAAPPPPPPPPARRQPRVVAALEAAAAAALAAPLGGDRPAAAAGRGRTTRSGGGGGGAPSLAADRAYNAALLAAGGGSDAALARALELEEQADADARRAAGVRGGREGGRRGAPRRLAALLSTPARERAAAAADADEDGFVRDQAALRWE